MDNVGVQLSNLFLVGEIRTYGVNAYVMVDDVDPDNHRSF
jgi:hypothetical protein